MFVDVCSFTAMSERLDPEDVRGIMEAAFEVILDIVHLHGGSVNQFLGDGVMALFAELDGAEDHQIRALQAALRMQADLARFREDMRRAHGVDFRVRVALHSGPITVGVIGRGLRDDYVSHGETVNVTARLLSIADPGGIVVSSVTRERADEALLLDYVPAGSAAARMGAWAVTSGFAERYGANALAGN